jgi:hypothetical protein
MKISRTRFTLLVAAAAIATLAAALLAFRHFYPPAAFKPEALEAYYAALRVEPSTPVDAAVVQAAAIAATAYIRRVTDENGQFLYLVNMDPAVDVPVDYSILRHQGTVFALGSSQDMMPDPANVEVMRRAVDYMRDCCYATIEGQRDDRGARARARCETIQPVLLQAWGCRTGAARTDIARASLAWLGAT